MDEREVKIGDVVVWHEANGFAVNALVNAIWSKKCINVIILSPDATRQDSYGRQSEHRTSCNHVSLSSVHGFYWRFPDEEPNPVVQPLAV